MLETLLKKIRLYLPEDEARDLAWNLYEEVKRDRKKFFIGGFVFALLIILITLG